MNDIIFANYFFSVLICSTIGFAFECLSSAIIVKFIKHLIIVYIEISMDTIGIYVSFSFLFNPNNTSILGCFF